MAAGGGLSTLGDWFAGHTASAPPVLAARARSYLAQARAGDGAPAALAVAAGAALRQVERQTNGRGTALDLLAADALITLALLAQAEQDPASLQAFASQLLQDGLVDA